jgi:tetratricopeptide (TPR) repeat protein
MSAGREILSGEGLFMRSHLGKCAAALIFLVAMATAWAEDETPSRSAEHIDAARTSRKLGMVDLAVKILEMGIAKEEKTLQKNPKDHEAAFELAQLQFELQRDEAAAKSIEIAIAVSPTEAKYHAFRGKMLSYGEDKDGAERSFQKAIELAPRKGTYYHQYSQLLYTLKKKEAAEAQLRKAVEMDPGFGEAYKLLAVYRYAAGKRDEVQGIVQQGVEKDPKHAGLRELLGEFYLEAGKSVEAYEQYTVMAELEPSNLKAQSKLVQLSTALGKKEESKTHLDNVFKLFRDGKVKEESFCREQFTVGKNPVMALEFFELKGPNAVKYYFQVNDEKGEKKLYAISLGSYPFTTELARANGTIKKDERMYHLDFYQGREHRTYGMYPVTPPSYDDVRKMVVEIIAGTRKPLSASVRAEEKKDEPPKSPEK